MSTAAIEKPAAQSQIRWAAAAIGFTAGLFAGMTESPVGSALVGAIVGLVGGGGFYALLVKAKAEKKPQEGAEKESEASADIDWPLVHTLARGVQVLCLLAIVGVLGGIALRQGWVLPKSNVPSEALTDLGQLAKKVERRVLLRLVLLQSELAALGVSVKENNRIVGSFVSESDGESDVDPGLALGETNLRQLRRDTRDAATEVRNALLSLSTESKDDPDAKLGEILDDEKRRLKQVSELRFGDVKQAYRHLRAALTAAEASKTYVEQATQPELSMLLDLVTRYREASVYVGETKRAGPLVRPQGLTGSDPERGLSIKP